MLVCKCRCMFVVRSACLISSLPCLAAFLIASLCLQVPRACFKCRVLASSAPCCCFSSGLFSICFHLQRARFQVPRAALGPQVFICVSCRVHVFRRCLRCTFMRPCVLVHSSDSICQQRKEAKQETQKQHTTHTRMSSHWRPSRP